MSETHCHTAILLDMRRVGVGVILSQSCSALIDSPYLLRRLVNASQIRYAFNTGQLLQTTPCRLKGKITEKMAAAGTNPLQLSN